MFDLRSLNLNLLTVFEAIYERGTVSGAAGHLALSQSATSHALSRLGDTCNALNLRAAAAAISSGMARSGHPTVNERLTIQAF
jgi:hypothetical protein